MNISMKAISTILEEKLNKDNKLYQQLKSEGRIFLLDVREMSDNDIVEKLGSIGVPVTREILKDFCRKFISADKLVRHLDEKFKVNAKKVDSDWLWLGICVLWERWFPEVANLEMIDDKIQYGYRFLKEKKFIEVIKMWGETWEDIKQIMKNHNLTYIHQFEEEFGGTQSIFNWSSDYAFQLENIAYEQNEYLQKRIDFCSEYIERYLDKTENNICNMIRAIGECYFKQGKYEKGDSYFQKYLKEQPTWGWGWIEWSDAYRLLPKKNRDVKRAIDILNQACKVKNLEDRRDVLERLKDIYEDLGQKEEENRINLEIKKIGETTRIKKVLAIKDETKVGRNEPCPCGSGKKYKKCCVN